MMLGDADIEAEMLAVMEEADPYLAALFNGDAGSMVISDRQVISVTNLIATVSNAASPELAQLIGDELDRLPSPQDFVDKSVSEVRTMLENGGYDTPLIRSVGGSVNDLAGSGLVLQNNGGDDLPISTNGAFIFNTLLEDGSVRGHGQEPAHQPRPALHGQQRHRHDQRCGSRERSSTAWRK